MTVCTALVFSDRLYRPISLYCRLWLSLLMIFIFSGCAHRPAQPIDDWTAHQARMQEIFHWNLTGKLGVRIPGDNGSANLRWQNTAGNYTLDLSGPFGQGRILITGSPDQVTLQQAGKAPITADSAEALIYQTTGWTLPVDQLAYWVRGIPAPHHPLTSLKKNEAGLPARLSQAGWEIHYLNYSAVETLAGAGLQLPGKITAQYGDIRLTLIVRQWQLAN